MTTLRWAYRRDDEPDWTLCDLPTSWEGLGRPKDDAGPYHFRARLVVEELPARLRFGAVSYMCTVFVDGIETGCHEGMWTSFSVPLPSVGSHDVELVIEKPASLTDGPDSAHAPGRFPTREVPGGFLPYVWGHLPGGPWLPVAVEQGDAALGEVSVEHRDGEVVVMVGGLADSAASWRLLDGDELLAHGAFADGKAAVVAPGAARAWAPDDPALYELVVSAGPREIWRGRVGFRSLGTDGRYLLLNGRPFMPRLVLSWGWYPERLDPARPPEDVERDLLAIRDLGFNGVKLCLWNPPDYFLEIASRLGMVVWLELPMWLPSPTPEFGRRLTEQGLAIVRQAVRHPCVCIYTLGCELNATVPAELLGGLFAQVKDLVGDALVCDNSGSGEAYGGLDVSFAEFSDHHLYCELEHIAQTLERFAPGWRGPRPWLIGEFCDYDTLRTTADTTRWYWSADPAVNPVGARWEHTLPSFLSNVGEAGLAERLPALGPASLRQATFHRKVTLEATRLRGDISGYVVTGERDTPISSAGIFDDEGKRKFAPAEWRSFQADTVLLLDPPRRRTWSSGGDRPAWLDPWCHWAGGRFSTWVVVSHVGAGAAPTQGSWRLSDGRGWAQEGTLATGRATTGVYELGLLEVTLPTVVGPAALTLRVEAGDVSNEWVIWVYPTGTPVSAALYDPSGRIVGSQPHFTFTSISDPLDVTAGEALVATQWDRALLELARRGSRVVFIGNSAAGPMAAEEVPFWRECVKVFHPAKVWDAYPHDGFTGSQFLGLGAERAFVDLPEDAKPALSRLDTRTGVRREYLFALPVGDGELVATTLELAGGRGSQPSGLHRNVGGAYLLRSLVETGM